MAIEKVMLLGIAVLIVSFLAIFAADLRDFTDRQLCYLLNENCPA